MGFVCPNRQLREARHPQISSALLRMNKQTSALVRLSVLLTSQPERPQPNGTSASSDYCAQVVPARGASWHLRRSARLADPEIVHRAPGRLDVRCLAAAQHAVALEQGGLIERRRTEPVLFHHRSRQTVDRERVLIRHLADDLGGKAA